VNATAAVLYVDANGSNPVSPYADWDTAATNIQDAIAVATAGDSVLVTNGVYAVGGVVIYGQVTNRVALTNAITVLSVNGPQVTTIAGGTRIRCAYVGSNSVLSGFTLTNGHASSTGEVTREMSGGGAWCEPGGVITNCIISGNSAPNGSSGGGGGIYGGTLYNCTLAGNSGYFGGGARASILWNCTLTANSADGDGGGGGASDSALYHCMISNNNARCYAFGGGTHSSVLFGCVVTGNRTMPYGGCAGTGFGGGTHAGTNYNCILIGNISAAGGGDYEGVNYNCLFVGNRAFRGAGSAESVLYNCTVVANIATNQGGGVYRSTLNYCIVYSNSAPNEPNWSGGTFRYSCTTPLPGGMGNISNDPLFLDPQHNYFQLQCGSPCIDAGRTNLFLFGPTNDIRGFSRPLDGNGDGIAHLDMGAYEFYLASDTFPLIQAGYTNFAANFGVLFTAQNIGCATSFWWDFADGIRVTNQSVIRHAWTSPGTYEVQLSAYYPDLGQTLTATTRVQVVEQIIHYVDINSSTPSYPYTNWMTAARFIVDAIFVVATPGRLVLVTNGVYRSDTVTLTNGVIVRSVNGPESTIIWPFLGQRCAYVSRGSFLDGFALTNGNTASSGDIHKDRSGGGAWCETGGIVTNCIITGNRASAHGGGAYQGTFFNCIFTNNSISGAIANGGGAYESVLHNCTLVSNRVSAGEAKGGGAYGGMLFNCLLAGNSSYQGGGTHSGTLYGCRLIGNRAFEGGGASSNKLFNCLLTGNSASHGGGASSSALFNCTVVGNSATGSGGGIGGFDESAYNSIIYHNTAPGSSPNWYGGFRFFNCCTIPTNSLSSGSITNDRKRQVKCI